MHVAHCRSMVIHDALVHIDIDLPDSPDITSYFAILAVASL
jgi:hypothetical protein